MLERLKLKSELLQYVVVLMTGTVAAQALGYVFAPIISRIYTPEESGELDLFIRIVAVGAAFATARYELTLPIVKNDSHSFRLYHVALRTTVIITLLSLGILLYPVFMQEEAIDYVFYIFVPIAIFLTAAINIGTNWAIRMKLFRSISASKIANSISSNLGKVLIGLTGFGYLGLIIGAVIGLILGNIWFVKEFFTSQKRFKIKSKSPRNFLLAKEYSEFPKINLPHVLLDLGKELMVAVFILHFFDKEIFGLYGHSFRMLRLPLIFVGIAIGQVFFQRCSEIINEGGDITPLIRKAIRTLFLLSIVPFTVVFFFGEEMFSFVFGQEWARSGQFSEIMAPWFMMIFIASPVSSLPLVINRQREFFRLAILGTSLMVAAISIPPYFFDATIEQTLWILSLSQAAYFVLTIFRIFHYVKKVHVK